MSSYADFIDLLAEIKTKEWGAGRWTAWLPGRALGHGAPIGSGLTEKDAIDNLLTILEEKQGE